MYRLILISSIALAIFLNYQQMSFAVCTEGPTDTFTCDTNPPNPDPTGVQEGSNPNDIIVNMLPGSEIDTSIDPGPDLTGIDADTGRITVTIDNAELIAQDYCIENSSNPNGGQITLMNAHLAAVSNNCISINGTGTYILDIKDSIITADDSTIIRTGIGDDIINVVNSEIKVLTASGNDRAIQTTNGNDSVTLENTLLVGGTTNQPVVTAVGLDEGNDTLKIGNGVQLRGLMSGNEETDGIISCGEDFDTIIFAMDVPPERLNLFSAEIAAADPAGDTIVINGLTYIWEDCELLVNELVGVRVTRPIPTLSQWGLIAMAGIIGLAGFIAVRKKYSTS